MELTELGLDNELAQHADCGIGQHLAQVTAVDRGRYIVRDEAGEVSAQLTGKFLYTAESSVDMPCVGDWVCVQYHDAASHASIHELVALDNGALLIDMPGCASWACLRS